MKDIEKKIKKSQYSSLNDLKKDVETLCTNAQTYNEDGSIIFTDAGIIRNACEKLVQDELKEHPELGEDRDGSTAPGTSTGTPVPASQKLKLTFNNSQYANGGSSGVQSDDDE